jgi:hypothetical protein
LLSNSCASKVPVSSTDHGSIRSSTSSSMNMDVRRACGT